MIRELFNWNDQDEETKKEVKQQWKEVGLMWLGAGSFFLGQVIGEKIYNKKYQYQHVGVASIDDDYYLYIRDVDGKNHLGGSRISQFKNRDAAVDFFKGGLRHLNEKYDDAIDEPKEEGVDVVTF